MSNGALPKAEEKATVVEAMFDRIAPRYDLMNRLLTFRLDQAWRKRMMRLLQVGPGDVVLDLGAGTGDLCELAAASGARPVALDFAAQMLHYARLRGVQADLVRADAARLPVAAESASVVVSAFALRNFVSIETVLREAARVLKPGGRLGLLEVDEPANPLLRWGHAFYFRRVVPFIGGLVSDRWAYSYLPKSTVYLPPGDGLVDLVTQAGFGAVRKETLSGGIAQIILGTRA